jgi:hypothetical protein
MMRKLATIAGTALLSAGLLGVSGGHHSASALMVTPNTNPNELSLYQVMDKLYGAGNWTQLDDSVYQRNTNMGVSYLVNFQAMYAKDTSQLGIFTNQTTYSGLINLSGGQAQPQSIVVTPTMQSSSVGGFFEWAFKNLDTGVIFSENKTKNPDGLDHLIAFSLNNMPNSGVFAWEDRVGGDYDYQDAIFQYTWQIVPTPVPEPTTLGLFAVACLGVAAAVRRRMTKA